MIRFTSGNLLDASTEALVNTVNEVGVMGKGIALMFKETFPESAAAYERAARSGKVHVGRVLVTEGLGLSGPRWIIHFPTKKHWRNPSKLEWVREGLVDLVRVIRELNIQSIAIPPLGAGNGKLDWALVRNEIELALGELSEVEVVVFEPSAAYFSEPKVAGLERLTPARALIAELVRRYSVLGLDCTLLEAQKLAWFLNRAITSLGISDVLDLDFKANHYGPYSDKLRHLLNGLDGSYLHSEKRVADTGPFGAVWFEPSRRTEVREYLESAEASPFVPALEKTTAVIDGFESPLGMELLATVDWLLVQRDAPRTVAGIRGALERWPGKIAAGERKLRLFDDRLLALALSRLVEEQPFA